MALGRLINARSLAEAQLACADLLDVVLEGAAAISLEAPEVVRALLALGPEPPFLSYRVSVFLYVAPWLGAWGAVERNPGSLAAEVHALATAERECQAFSSEFARTAARRPLTEEAEGRALLYRLWGVYLPANVQSYNFLDRGFQEESHPEARASTVEGMTVLLARDESVSGEDDRARQLRRYIAQGPREFLLRASNAPWDWYEPNFNLQRRRCEDILAVPITDAAPERYWPSELF